MTASLRRGLKQIEMRCNVPDDPTRRMRAKQIEEVSQDKCIRLYYVIHLVRDDTAHDTTLLCAVRRCSVVCATHRPTTGGGPRVREGRRESVPRFGRCFIGNARADLLPPYLRSPDPPGAPAPRGRGIGCSLQGQGAGTGSTRPEHDTCSVFRSSSRRAHAAPSRSKDMVPAMSNK